MQAADTGEPTPDELRVLRHLSRAVDDLLEEALKARENLAQTFRRCFPTILSLTGAKGIVITTQNEELEEESYSEGQFNGADPSKLLSDHPWGIHKLGSATLISQSLDVVGAKVGGIGILFDGDFSEPKESRRITRIVEVIAEEFDTVLASVQTAAEKHQLILKFNELLANPVFEKGMDQAVLALAEQVKLPGFILCYRDAVRKSVLHYRTYRNGHLEYESGVRPFPQIEKAIADHGTKLVSRAGNLLRESLHGFRTAEAVLISGVQGSEPLGKIMVWSNDEGFSAYVMDLVRILASVLTQRLVDYNRERIHLSQFFAANVIDELLEDPDYQHRYLTPRDEEVGLLFADINGFTRICEQVLEAPTRIGNFVDRWSVGVVDILWKHGGVFDKMVGDCVIGLFGPPFFRSSRLERAEAVTKAALEIQAFTEKMSADPEVARIAEKVKLPGLGVAIGINLSNTFCGLFGPNQNYTGFSTGMNQTARLQSLGQFRETLVMESVQKALADSKDPLIKGLSYGAMTETPVKNVSHPLRYAALSPKK